MKVGKVLPGWMKPLVEDAIAAELSPETTETAFGVARTIAWSLEALLVALLGGRRVAVEAAPFIEKVSVSPNLVDVEDSLVEVLIEAICPYGDQQYIDEVFVLERGKKRAATRAVIDALQLRFGKARPLSLPKSSEPAFAEALRERRPDEAMLVALIRTLERAGFSEAAQTLNHHGRRFATYFEKRYRSGTDAMGLMYSLSSVLPITLTGDRLPPQESDTSIRPYSPAAVFVRNELLRHPKFGVGRVEDIGSLSVLVRFSDNATRRLTHAGK